MNEDEDVKITIILQQDKGNLLAKATISLNTLKFGFVTIKGFNIWKSSRFNGRLQEAIFIQPPVKIGGGHAYPQVFFDREKGWIALEEAIYNKFNLTRNEKRALLTEEDVNLEDLDKKDPF